MTPGSKWIGRYEVLAEIGRGGAGRVLRARSPEGREVAIKVLLAAEDPDQLARFAREAEILAELGEAHGFVPVLDRGETPEGPFIVLPFLTGGTLRARLEKGKPGVEKTVALGLALARALAAAHARGIVHRDLKPENVLFTADGRPLIADLGLARLRFGAGSLTQSGVVGGTLGYMPPEQLDGFRAAGPPADVFALGAILYESLAGKRAFQATGILRFVQELERGPPPLAAACPEAPVWLVSVVERALAREPGARFADGSAFAAALESRAVVRRRRGVFAVVALVGVLCVALGIGLSRAKSPAPAVPAPAVPPVARVETAILSPQTGDLLSQDFTVKATVAGSTATRAEIALVLSSGEVRRVEQPIGPGGMVEAKVLVPPVEAVGRVDLRLDGKTVKSVAVALTQAPLSRLPVNLVWKEKAWLPDGTRVEVYEYATPAHPVRMVWVPPGSFFPGHDEQRREASTGFWIGRYETTRDEYLGFCDASGYPHPENPTFLPALENPGQHPVSNVSWNDADQDRKWARLRLPTSDEWVRAARGSDRRPYTWGNAWEPKRANFADSSCPSEVKLGDGGTETIDRDPDSSDGFPYTAPVGSFPGGVSPVGALDMIGNVWEMTEDKRFRGGSWSKPPAACTIPNYVGAGQEGNYRGIDLGFRVALSAR